MYTIVTDMQQRVKVEPVTVLEFAMKSTFFSQSWDVFRGLKAWNTIYSLNNELNDNLNLIVWNNFSSQMRTNEQDRDG